MNDLQRHWVPAGILAVLLATIIAAATTAHGQAVPPVSTLVAIRAGAHPQATPPL